ncbi:FAD/NAD(P)-binding domain-containing protein [Pholiota molesta]|nr:FAD/NAD(P)-binding domain-containing protein [Pholiota molesta]
MRMRESSSSHDVQHTPSPLSAATLILRQGMPLRIGIIGGGIGGLSLAVALSSLNLDPNAINIDIYEAAPELTQIGAGITFWPRAWKILEKLGVTAELATYLAPGQHVPDGLGFQFRKSDQREGMSIRDLVFAGTPLSFHRAIVQEVLLKHLSPSITCHLSSRLVSYTELTADAASPIQLTFADGRTAACDLLIGADGIKSIIRKQLVSENPEASNAGHADADPVWSGTLAYRCAVDSSVLRAKMPEHRALTTHVVYCGKNQHVVAYPILQGRVVNVAAYISDLSKEGTKYTGPSFEDVTKEEVIPFFDVWEEEVQQLVHNTQKPSRWAIHAIRPLSSYVSASGRILLLGDAAHAMTPHQGNGAGQAIEDAYILAHLIAEGLRSSASVPTLTRVYDAIRRPAANLVHHFSRMHGLLYEFNVPEHGKNGSDEDEDTGNEESWTQSRVERLGDVIVRDWRYAWETTAEEDHERALLMLK